MVGVICMVVNFINISWFIFMFILLYLSFGLLGIWVFCFFFLKLKDLGKRKM